MEIKTNENTDISQWEKQKKQIKLIDNIENNRNYTKKKNESQQIFLKQCKNKNEKPLTPKTQTIKIFKKRGGKDTINILIQYFSIIIIKIKFFWFDILVKEGELKFFFSLIF